MKEKNLIFLDGKLIKEQRAFSRSQNMHFYIGNVRHIAKKNMSDYKPDFGCRLWQKQEIYREISP